MASKIIGTNDVMEGPIGSQAVSTTKKLLVLDCGHRESADLSRLGDGYLRSDWDCSWCDYLYKLSRKEVA